MFWQPFFVTPEFAVAVYQDFLHWYLTEYRLYQRTSGAKLENSALVNLSQFNYRSINTTNGYRRLCYLLDNRSQQEETFGRLVDFYASCLVKYGDNAMNHYIDRSLRSLSRAYGLPLKTVRHLQRHHHTAWTVPLFKQADQELLNH